MDVSHALGGLEGQKAGYPDARGERGTVTEWPDRIEGLWYCQILTEGHSSAVTRAEWLLPAAHSDLEECLPRHSLLGSLSRMLLQWAFLGPLDGRELGTPGEHVGGSRVSPAVAAQCKDEVINVLWATATDQTSHSPSD